MRKIFELLWMILVGVSIAGCGSAENVAEENVVWYEKAPVVCHALGRTEDGDLLTNSKEALEYNYQWGQRVFEVDLAMTSDEVVVLRHDWDFSYGQGEDWGWTEEEKPVPDAETFLSTPIYDKYTPMSLLDLYKQMSKKKDLYVILDSKSHSDVSHQYSIIVNTAIDNGYEDVLDRVIPQIYYEGMYDEINNVYAFKEYIFTLYMIGYQGAEKVGAFCNEKGISTVVMPYEWFGAPEGEALKEYSLQIYVHTVNEMPVAEKMIQCGADGIYTDHILPEVIEELKEK